MPSPALKARCHGERLHPSRRAFRVALKAATYHALEIADAEAVPGG